jgi:hypothetical protein
VIKITQGDTAVLNLTATNGQGALVNLTGAVFTTQIKAADGTVKSFPNSQHTANPDQSGSGKGKFTLSLTIIDTDALAVGSNHEIVTKIVQGLSTIYYHGRNQLTVYQKTPAT